jgi:hypothetical protein
LKFLRQKFPLQTFLLQKFLRRLLRTGFESKGGTGSRVAPSVARAFSYPVLLFPKLARERAASIAGFAKRALGISVTQKAQVPKS